MINKSSYTKLLEQINLESELQNAFINNEFVVHYQPKVQLQTGKLTGTEALLRWQHPHKGLIAPSTFIPLLERNGSICELGKWILKTACLQNSEWSTQGLNAGKIAVNLSGIQLLQKDLCQFISDTLSECGLPADSLELELTESLLINDTKTCADILSGLKEIGVSIAIDDFGTGYNSFNYLRYFPFNSLKIDRSFLCDIPACHTNTAITKAIVELAKELEVNVTAEGVENYAQVEFLRDLETDEIQGYLISPALPCSSLVNLIHDEECFERRLVVSESDLRSEPIYIHAA